MYVGWRSTSGFGWMSDVVLGRQSDGWADSGHRLGWVV